MGRTNLSLRQLQKVLQDSGSENPRRGRSRGRRSSGGARAALELGQAIRGRLYRAGPIFKSNNPGGGDPIPGLGEVNSYFIEIGGKTFNFSDVERLIKEELRKPTGWELEGYLWKASPTRTDFTVASEALLRIWNKLQSLP